MSEVTDETSYIKYRSILKNPCNCISSLNSLHTGSNEKRTVTKTCCLAPFVSARYTCTYGVLIGCPAFRTVILSSSNIHQCNCLSCCHQWHCVGIWEERSYREAWVKTLSYCICSAYLVVLRHCVLSELLLLTCYHYSCLHKICLDQSIHGFRLPKLR